MDVFSIQKRSEVMARIRRRDTSPELAVRKIVSTLGYRYRLDYAKLPGRPDIAIMGKKIAIFVHGCFWHQHSGCKIAHMPKSRSEYWLPKLAANRKRDAKHIRSIRKLGWSVLVVRECEIRNPEKAFKKILGFLNS